MQSQSQQFEYFSFMEVIESVSDIEIFLTEFLSLEEMCNICLNSLEI